MKKIEFLVAVMMVMVTVLITFSSDFTSKNAEQVGIEYTNFPEL